MSAPIVAVDYGTKRIGLAATDALGLVLPLPLLLNEGDAAAAARVADVAHDRGADRIIIGMPINMDGTVGPAAKRVEAFAKLVERALGDREPRVSVIRRDERLTSWEAEAALSAGGVHPRDRKGKVDTIAAQLLLRDFLAETDSSFRRIPEEAEPPPDPEKARRRRTREERDRHRGPHRGRGRK